MKMVNDSLDNLFVMAGGLFGLTSFWAFRCRQRWGCVLSWVQRISWRLSSWSQASISVCFLTTKPTFLGELGQLNLFQLSLFLLLANLNLGKPPSFLLQWKRQKHFNLEFYPNLISYVDWIEGKLIFTKRQKDIAFDGHKMHLNLTDPPNRLYQDLAGKIDTVCAFFVFWTSATFAFFLLLILIRNFMTHSRQQKLWFLQ